MVGITVRMPESFHTRLRVALAGSRASAQDVALECLKDYVRQYEKKQQSQHVYSEPRAHYGEG